MRLGSTGDWWTPHSTSISRSRKLKPLRWGCLFAPGGDLLHLSIRLHQETAPWHLDSHNFRWRRDVSPQFAMFSSFPTISATCLRCHQIAFVRNGPRPITHRLFCNYKAGGLLQLCAVSLAAFGARNLRPGFLISSWFGAWCRKAGVSGVDAAKLETRLSLL